jgi:plastocyanin
MARLARFPAFVAVLPLTCLLLAGCSGSGGDGDGSSSSSSSSSDTGSAAPGIATSLGITRAPASAPAGSKATVCWEVFGAGKVPHTAIHWDNESHAAEPGRTFQDYSMGVSYPDNETAASPAGYQLDASGAEFCTGADMPASGSIFVVAHVIDSTGAPGRLSTEREIRVGAASDAEIHVQAFTYSPNPLTVAPGATVSVMNMDTLAHTATGDGGSFDTGDVGPGETETFTAPLAPGSYSYGCAYHDSMAGVVQVVA